MFKDIGYIIQKVALNFDDNFYIQIFQVMCQLLHSTNERCFRFQSKHCYSAPFVQVVLGFKILSWGPAMIKIIIIEKPKIIIRLIQLLFKRYTESNLDKVIEFKTNVINSSAL